MPTPEKNQQGLALIEESELMTILTSQGLEITPEVQTQIAQYKETVKTVRTLLQAIVLQSPLHAAALREAAQKFIVPLAHAQALIGQIRGIAQELFQVLRDGRGSSTPQSELTANKAENLANRTEDAAAEMRQRASTSSTNEVNQGHKKQVIESTTERTRTIESPDELYGNLTALIQILTDYSQEEAAIDVHQMATKLEEARDRFRNIQAFIAMFDKSDPRIEAAFEEISEKLEEYLANFIVRMEGLHAATIATLQRLTDPEGYFAKLHAAINKLEANMEYYGTDPLANPRLYEQQRMLEALEEAVALWEELTQPRPSLILNGTPATQ